MGTTHGILYAVAVYLSLFFIKEVNGNDNYNISFTNMETNDLLRIVYFMVKDNAVKFYETLCDNDVYVLKKIKSGTKHENGNDNLENVVERFSSNVNATNYLNIVECAANIPASAVLYCQRIPFRLLNCGHRLYKFQMSSSHCPLGYVLVMSAYNQVIKNTYFTDITGIPNTQCEKKIPCPTLKPTTCPIILPTARPTPCPTACPITLPTPRPSPCSVLSPPTNLSTSAPIDDETNGTTGITMLNTTFPTQEVVSQKDFNNPNSFVSVNNEYINVVIILEVVSSAMILIVLCAVAYLLKQRMKSNGSTEMEPLPNVSCDSSQQSCTNEYSSVSLCNV